MCITFSDYEQICLFTHGRAETPTGHEVGHADDWVLMALGAYLPRWFATRLDRVDDAQYVRSRLSREPHVLNVVADFIYNPTPEEQNVVVFDHHDPSTSQGLCSAHLLMQELARQGIISSVPDLMQELSLWDVVGPQAVKVENRPDPDRYTAILAAEPKEGFDFETASFIIEKLYASGSIREFVDALFFAENDLGRTARRIYSEIQATRESTIEQILAGTVVKTSPSGVKYIELRQSPAGLIREIFSRKGVDIVIHPNERNEDAFSIVRDSSGRFATTPVAELVEVASDKIVFCHPGGFLLVAKPPFAVK